MTQEFGFGCLFKEDSRDWPVSLLRNMVDSGNAVPVAWDCPVVLRQGSTNHCVGFASAGFWAAAQKDAPINSDITNDIGHALYYEAKVIDGEPHGEEGSYVRSGMGALKDRGVIDAYAFARFDDANEWVQTTGPAVIGIPWYLDMCYPNNAGVIQPTGEYKGGHAILWRGDKQGPADNLLHNSWGHDWGNEGRCYISDEALRDLIDYRYGTACVAVKLIGVPWPDWGNEDRMAAVYVHAAGLMQGYPDGTFKPYLNMTLRQVALVASRAGLPYPMEWLDSYQSCSRACVRDTFPMFEWNTADWQKPYLRRHMVLQLYRWKRGQA